MTVGNFIKILNKIGVIKVERFGDTVRVDTSAETIKVTGVGDGTTLHELLVGIAEKEGLHFFFWHFNHRNISSY